MKKTIVTIFLLFLATQIIAQEKLQPLVSVTGEGIVKIVPDQVSIRVSVESQGKEAQLVKTTNDKAIDGVLKFLKNEGLQSKDIQTQYVNLGKNYDYNTKTYSYKASQSITILIRDLKKYDALITGLLKQGINRIDWITFGTEEMEKLQSRAREKAIENAKQKAEEYANVLGQKIGKAIQISEMSKSQSPEPFYRVAAMDMEYAGANSKETLAVGEMVVKAQINVSFELF